MNRIHSHIKFSLLSIGGLLLLLVAGCKPSPKIPDTDIQKWERAVVNIECRQQRYTQEDIDELIEQEKQANRLTTEEQELQRRVELGRETNPVSGTAIYLLDHGKRYLVTAKHVIYDPQESEGSGSARLFKDISIRTPYEYFLKRKVNNSSIPSTGYGQESPFYLSDNTTDIGIISLQASLTKFLVNTLEEDGYQPIELSDIEQVEQVTTGEKIAAIGYPDISRIGVFQKLNDYQSNVVVLPVSTFGNIAMTHQQLSYFIGDITVYPGNSGGPVLRNNKLIGVVSGQVLIPIDTKNASTNYTSSSLSSRGTLAKVIKAEHILHGLRQLQSIEASPSFR